MATDVQFLFGQFVPNCNHIRDKQFDYYVLQLSDGGSVDLTIDAQHFRLEGRWFWSSYPGPRIAFKPTEPGGTWVHRYLAFGGPGVRQWIKQGIFPIPPQPVHQRDDYPRRFDELLELSRRTDKLGTARASLLLESILTELAETRARPEASPTWLAPVLSQAQLLGAHVHTDELAAEAGMTPRSFRRRFTQEVGQSPRNYVIACRIGHAKDMLGRTELPIKQIAQQLGYNDVYFFTRQFKKVTGVAPSAYRKSREG
jgi:AraC family transcriptional regulator of arabinose operon